jgi:hypothetical protein
MERLVSSYLPFRLEKRATFILSGRGANVSLGEES